MSEKTTKRNPLLLTLCIVLAVAVILAVVLFNQRANLAAQVSALTDDLSASRTSWETTSAEKEALQEELTTAQNDLREAQTALDESTAKITTLEAQIATLTADVAQAELALGTATDLNADLTASVDALTAEKETLTATISSLTAEKETLTANVDTLTEQVNTLTAQVEALNAEVEALNNAAATQSAEDDEPVDPSTEDAEPVAAPTNGIAAWVNGQPITEERVAIIADNMLYSYSQYGYDTTNATLVSMINGYALEYAVQMELMAQHAAEWGIDQPTDEEQAELQATVDTEWETLIDTYITYYITLADDATDEDKAAARETAVTELEEMGYTYDLLMQDYTNSLMYEKVEARMTEDAVVADEDVVAYFNELVDADMASYGSSIATYEYCTQYYGYTSYYQPEGYRGITHILLTVDDALLAEYQSLLSTFESQDTTATDTDLITQEQVDAAYAAVIASVQPTIDEINQKLADGADFSDLIAEYGQDPGMQSEPYKTEGYPVHADSVVWDPVFVQAAFSVDNVGDVAEPVLGSYGVHIVKYLRDVPAGAVELTEDIQTALREELESDKHSEAFSAVMTEWMNTSEIVYAQSEAETVEE